MSFLGSIGTIMDESELKELIFEFYAPASVDKILGHAYSRALRAHTLEHCTFVQMILSSTNFRYKDTSKIEILLQNPETVLKNIEGENTVLDNIKSKFIETVKRLSKRSETATLWVQYLHMLSLLKLLLTVAFFAQSCMASKR